MDEEAANVFMTNLVKNIQMLCHGHLPFSDNVEVIGHLYLNIDCGKKLNYIVNEKYSKLNQATTFTSNSFHAEPSKDKSSHAKNSSNAPELHGNVRKFKRAAKSLSVSSSPSKVRKIREEYRDDPVNDVNDSVDNSLGVTFSIQRNDNDQERIPSINSSNVIIKSETNQHTFKTEVENPTPTLEGDPSDVQYASGSTSNPNDSYSSFYSPADGENEESESDEIMGGILQHEYKDEDIEYTIIEMGTQQGRPMLVDSIGYCYTMRKKTDLCVRWWCSLRNRHGRCPGSVAQRGESFKRGSIKHTHDPKPGLLTAKLVVAEARAQANNDFVTPISEVVERAMSVKGTEDESILPKQSNLKRMINRHRQQKRQELFHNH
ncbi:uncharacterized protein LOC126815510 isoform X2 [Patella vulgata]|uniref:uncharacterized protein LOC126815510 isoform X2 n=1 Tax=Patella vulgata TaxID=6465 RepID=UPI00217F6C72|nr:uncharacterized protein LOC126815510 isoform X2 [Patella vulgata]